MRAPKRRWFVAFILIAVIAACSGGGGGGGTTAPSTTYTVTYYGNGNTGGNVPVDSNTYQQGQRATVLANTGNLVRTGFTFDGWNTQANGSGASYMPYSSCQMGTANVTLYAQWTVNGAGGYTVTYVANGGTGTVPIDSNSYVTGETVTVPANSGSLTYPGYAFVGWQTKADGSGATYRGGGTFTMGSANTTLYALWAGGYAYTVNWSDSTVSQYTIGPNGALTPMFTPAVTTTGYDPRWLTVDTSGRYLYVSNNYGSSPISGCNYSGCGNIAQFTIGADGSLSTLPTSTFVPSGPAPAGGAVHPTKPWYYVTTGWSNISQNIINADGSLTSMATSTVFGGQFDDSITIDPSGKWAYVANGDNNTVRQYMIDQITGELSPMATPSVATGRNAYDIAIVSISSVEYAYVANYDDGTISQYKIDSISGMLTSMGTATASPGGNTLSIAVDPLGRFAYAPINASQSAVIAQFQINQTTGALESNGTVSAAQGMANWIAIESSGKYAYATSGDNGAIGTTISQYTIDQTTGALTLMSNPSVQTGFSPSQIVTVGK